MSSDLQLNQPANPNHLRQRNFEGVFTRIPNTQFAIQQCNIPGISVPIIRNANPNAPVAVHGDTMVQDELSLEFLVDEEMKNWQELKDWLTELSNPITSDSYKTMMERPVHHPKYGPESQFSVLVKTNALKAQYEFRYSGVIITGLGGLQFSITDTENTRMTAMATFAYSYFTIREAS